MLNHLPTGDLLLQGTVLGCLSLQDKKWLWLPNIKYRSNSEFYRTREANKPAGVFDICKGASQVFLNIVRDYPPDLIFCQV